MSTTFRPRSKRRQRSPFRADSPLNRRLYAHAVNATRQVRTDLLPGSKRASRVHFLSTGSFIDTPYEAHPLAEALLAKAPGEIAVIEVYGAKGDTTRLGFIRAGAIAFIEAL